jgi:hypothetical protein
MGVSIPLRLRHLPRSGEISIFLFRLIDSGFVSEAAVCTLKSGTDGQPNGLRVLAAMSHERHGRRVGRTDDPPGRHQSRAFPLQTAAANR